MFNTFFRVGMIALFTLALIAVLHSNLRKIIKNKFSPHQRVILSKISGPVLGLNSHANIFKIKTANGIFLEV